MLDAKGRPFFASKKVLFSSSAVAIQLSKSRPKQKKLKFAVRPSDGNFQIKSGKIQTQRAGYTLSGRNQFLWPLWQPLGILECSDKRDIILARKLAHHRHLLKFKLDHEKYAREAQSATSLQTFFTMCGQSHSNTVKFKRKKKRQK